MLSRTALIAAALTFAAPLTTSHSANAQGAPMQLGPKAGSPASNAIQRAAPPARVPTQDAAAAIRRANAYFNSISTMVGDFVQTGADGRSVEGKLYVQKPGKLRFDYARPSPLEIIADGTSVAIRNRKLNTQDLYFISQTPLKFLLKGNLDLARDTKILDVTTRADTTTILIEDKATLGGTSRIALTFRNEDFGLTGWVVNDAQGSETTVRLANLNFQQKPDDSLFKINYERQDTF